MKQSERREIIKAKGGKCLLCGIKVNVATAEIHHIDGNKKNNRLSNLEVHCKKCHRKVTKTQTATRAADRKRLPPILR